ncbi:MAG: NTP transferase domain-containing protein, partial [Sphingomonadales bacterium]|nr:NTP transferase domain-containing protein [Sphingomonadales bacterium]
MVEDDVIEPIMGVVLAGGKSSRMGEIDKPELIFQDKTLIFRAVEKLSPQVAEVCLSAPHSYGLDTIAIADDVAAQGPLGGVYSVLRHVVKDHSDIKAILTVPVDAPFFPDNLADE